MKREGQKMRMFALKAILERETDDRHGINMECILQLLQTEYGIVAERKSIYDDMRVLRESDFLDVTPPQGKDREYSVASRTFELPELKMMIDSIQSSKFLSERKSRDLIHKIETLCSKHEANTFQREVVLANRVKSTNTKIYFNIDAIHAAIANNSQISFRYFDYDLNKERKYFKKGEKYIASPWKLIYADENYYLLAFEGGKFKHFRVDKMEDVVEAAGEREGADDAAKLDMSNYNKYTFSMYGGEVEHVTMVFQNRMMGAVMDRFGHDVLIMKEDDRHFRITVPVAISFQFFGWVFGLGKMVRIVGPEDVKAKMKKALEDILERYE